MVFDGGRPEPSSNGRGASLREALELLRPKGGQDASPKGRPGTLHGAKIEQVRYSTADERSLGLAVMKAIQSLEIETAGLLRAVLLDVAAFIVSAFIPRCAEAGDAKREPPPLPPQDMRQSRATEGEACCLPGGSARTAANARWAAVRRGSGSLITTECRQAGSST